ncbi:helix-hairpin-helix domain-containing protein [Actinokineospora sp. 24-640]
MSELKARQFDDALTRLARAIDRPWDGRPNASIMDSDRPPLHRFLGRWGRSGSFSGQLPVYPTEDPDAPPEPPARRRHRVPLFAAIAAVVLGALLAGFLALPSGPPVPAEPPPAIVPMAAAATPTLVVDVQGKVVKPGLRTLPEGSRVADAITASGGTVPGTDTSTLNLARHLTDGEQIQVGKPPPIGADPTNPPLVNLNTAPVHQLDSLPGVGIVTAQRIVEYRNRKGGFTKIAQLREIEGIGPSRYEKLKDLVTVN